MIKVLLCLVLWTMASSASAGPVEDCAYLNTKELVGKLAGQPSVPDLRSKADAFAKLSKSLCARLAAQFNMTPVEIDMAVKLGASRAVREILGPEISIVKEAKEPSPEVAQAVLQGVLRKAFNDPFLILVRNSLTNYTRTATLTVGGRQISTNAAGVKGTTQINDRTCELSSEVTLPDQKDPRLSCSVSYSCKGKVGDLQGKLDDSCINLAE